MSAMARRVPVGLALLVVWVLLSGEPSVGNIVAGLIVVAVVMAVFPVQEAESRHRIHLLALVRLQLFMAWNLVSSSVTVVMASLFPTPDRLRSAIVRVELPGASHLVTTIVANCISLTPGTVTVTAEDDPAALHVHVMGLDDPDAFRAQIRDLHARVTAAVTPRAEGVAS